MVVFRDEKYYSETAKLLKKSLNSVKRVSFSVKYIE